MEDLKCFNFSLPMRKNSKVYVHKSSKLTRACSLCIVSLIFYYLTEPFLRCILQILKCVCRLWQASHTIGARVQVCYCLANLFGEPLYDKQTINGHHEQQLKSIISATRNDIYIHCVYKFFFFPTTLPVLDENKIPRLYSKLLKSYIETVFEYHAQRVLDKI